MARKVAAGLVMYRKTTELELFFVHPGGPFYANKHQDIWSIPKGLVEEGEDLLFAAKREFFEETGIEPAEELLHLDSVKHRSGKIVHAWAFEKDFVGTVQSNTCTIQWPPRSGQTLVIPEVDVGEYFTFSAAQGKVLPAQLAFFERLERLLSS